MGRRNIIQQFQVVEDGDMSGNVTGKATVVEQVDKLRYEVRWTGTSIDGTFGVEVSDDDVNYQPLEFDDSPATDGDTGAHTLNVSLVNFKFARLTYTFVAGTGTFQGFIKGHTVGA